MLIRAVQAEDLQAVSELCMRSFMTTVAPSLSAEGVASFTQIAATTSLAERLQDDNLMLLAAHEGCPFGYIELKQGQHLAMLFVEPSQQRQGIGVAQALGRNCATGSHGFSSRGAFAGLARGVQQACGDGGLADIRIGAGDEISGAHRGFSRTAYTT